MDLTQIQGFLNFVANFMPLTLSRTDLLVSQNTKDLSLSTDDLLATSKDLLLSLENDFYD